MRPPSSILAAAVACALAPAAGAQQSAATPEPSAEELFGVGFRWELAPLKLRDGWTRHGLARLVPSGTLSVFATENGSVVAHHVETAVAATARGSAARAYRLAARDRDGKLHAGHQRMRMARGSTAITVHYLPEVAPGAVAEVALAVLDLDGRRKRSAAARGAAREAGADVLPLPVIGEKLTFELPTMSGGRVRSQDLLGKVVLLDCWASW